MMQGLFTPLSDEPSHESRNASTSKTSLYHKHKPVIVASKHACWSAVQSEVGVGPATATQEFSCGRCVVRPCSGLGAGDQHAVLVMRDG